MSSTILKDLEEIIDSGLNSVVFPYQKGKSVRIKNMIVRESKAGYLVYNTETNSQIAKTFCKTTAIAIAKTQAQGKDIIKDALSYDRVIEKNYNDALFYKNKIRKTKASFERETRRIRLQIAIDRTRWAKDHLDQFIFGS